MPSAGAVCPPVILPIRKQVYGQSTSRVDTSTLIEIICDTPDTKIYFTANGTKPLPFQRKIGGNEVTHRYTAPFTLKEGKRTIKAVAVTRDGIKESDVFSKSFVVDDIAKINSSPIPTSSSSDLDTTDFFDSDGLDYTDSTLKSSKSSKSSKGKTKKKSKSPIRNLRSRSRSKSPTRQYLPKDAWASGTVTETDGEYPPIPDGPFNPTNYSGTQINVWGGAPPPLVQGVPGVVNLGQPGICNPYTTQYGYLTENMLQNCNPDTKHVTVGDLRKMMRSRQQDTPPAVTAPPPAETIEVPVYKDPPLNPISPGGGDYKGNLLHVYAHLINYANNHKDFRLPVADPKMGKILEGKFTDQPDCFEFTLVFEKPGIKRGSIKKPEKKPEKPKPKPKKEEKKVEKKEVPKPKPKPKKPPTPEKDPFFAMETEDLNQQGTVQPYAKFNAEQDAEVLKGAMKGLGTDEETLINVLCYRSNTQRQELVSTYKTMFGKDLIEDIKSETSGHFCDTLKALLMAPAEYDAYQLRKAMKGLGTDEDVLIEILCTRSNAQLKEIIRVYKEKFNRDLEKDIISDTSGHFKKLLVSLLQASRSDSKEVDRNKANQDAKELYQAGEKKWGTDESKFNTILVTRSYPQLRATFEEYQKISKKDIEGALKSEMSGDILRGMLTVVRCIKHKFNHFARQLQKTMKGIGTDDDTLVRVVVSRCEIDLANIKEEFQKLTGQTLDQYISDDISGDYRDAILSLVVGGEPPDMASKSGKGFVEAVKHKTEEELDEDIKMESEPVQEDPTLVPAENFNAETDSEVLRKAMKGFGTDEAALIKVIGYRSNDQMLEVVKTYKTMFGRDLIADLKSETSGGFKKLLVGLCMVPADFDAMSLHNAIKGLGTDEQVLIEIICSRSNQQLKDIKAAYKTNYNKELEADVSGDTSGDFRKILISCLQANRPEGQEFDRNKAKQDAQALYDAGEKKWGTDESRFNMILSARSFPQLRATFQEYAKIANKDIDDTIQSEMSGDLKNSMLTIVRCIRNKAAHFASELHKSMKGLGTDDDTLCRVVVSRACVDMVQIKQEFQKMFKQTLGSFCADDLSGDYKKLCLAVIREESAGK
ncbi:annexin A6-like [Ruditapes philippinarum]|uniref:annexin A6-like n=1 Tax=Ruditapes philippinarum TaxID=129788 RepID=UPI00295C0D6F|nr:annexin A6-like [Ruditapes philippinarum]